MVVNGCSEFVGCLFTRLRSLYPFPVCFLQSSWFLWHSVKRVLMCWWFLLFLLFGCCVVGGGRFNCFLSDCILKLVSYSYIAFSVSSWLSVGLWRQKDKNGLTYYVRSQGRHRYRQLPTGAQGNSIYYSLGRTEVSVHNR